METIREEVECAICHRQVIVYLVSIGSEHQFIKAIFCKGCEDVARARAEEEVLRELTKHALAEYKKRKAEVLEQYKNGEYSAESAAEQLKMPLAEFMERAAEVLLEEG